MGEIGRGSPGVREPADKSLSRDPAADNIGERGLVFLGNRGRRLVAAVEVATNVLIAVGGFFFEAIIAISSPVVAVLPEDGNSLSLSSSLADSCGETKRAVGRGPDEDGPLDFFNMGCGGGGLEALDEKLLAEMSFAFAGGGGET